MKILSIAEKNKGVKKYLIDREFYLSTSKKRMRIVKSNEFFLCMQDNGCDSLFPSGKIGMLFSKYMQS